MDWWYLKQEIIDNIIWDLEDGKDFSFVVEKNCREYTMEFPNFSNNISFLKNQFYKYSSDLITKKIKL